MANRLQDIILRDTRANQPLPADVPIATLYGVTDEGDIIERNSGSAWENYSPTAGSPSDADYLVKTTNGSLSAERVVTDTTSVTWDWATGGQAKAQRAALTGDVTASANSNATTIANDAVTTAKIINSAVTLAKIANAAASSKLLGSGASGSGAAYAELTLGTGLSMSGTTLSASTVSGGTVLTADPGSPADDTWWVVRTGTSPTMTLALKVQISGATVTLASITL